MAIDIADGQSDFQADHALLRKAVEETLKDAGCEKTVSLALVGADEMKRLNRSYTGRDGLTDVLAFAQDEEDLLGDVVICPARALEESAARSNGPMDELVLYAVHGTLHLLGYDDHGEEADEMYAKEDDILKRLGVEVD